MRDRFWINGTDPDPHPQPLPLKVWGVALWTDSVLRVLGAVSILRMRWTAVGS